MQVKQKSIKLGLDLHFQAIRSILFSPSLLECYLLRNLSLSKPDHSLCVFLPQGTNWPTQGPAELIRSLN